MNTLQSEKISTLLFDCNRFELTTLADSLRLLGLDIVASAGESQSAYTQFASLRPRSIVINFQGCDKSCLELLFRMRRESPSLGIVILTDSPDLRLYGIHERDLPKGTQLIEKSAMTSMGQIGDAIESSLKVNAEVRWIANEWSPTLDSLTDIQIETLRLLAQGLSNSDIGKVRYVSEKSVEQTITRIAQHLNVVHERGRNMRVILASEYYKWIGAPREHAI